MIGTNKKTMTKQITARRDETPLHTAVREDKTELLLEMIGEYDGVELKELLAEQNQSGETALYVAAEFGHTDMVKILMKYSDSVLAGTKAKNGFDAFHIAAKNGNLKVLDVFMEVNPELSFTFDSSKTTALHTAASHGHGEIVCFLLEKDRPYFCRVEPEVFQILYGIEEKKFNKEDCSCCIDTIKTDIWLRFERTR